MSCEWAQAFQMNQPQIWIEPTQKRLDVLDGAGRGAGPEAGCGHRVCGLM